MKTTILADRLMTMNESQTIGMAKKARELASKGIDVINLSFGEPDFQTPSHIKEAAKKAIDEGYTFYPPVAGYLDLRKAIAEKLRRDNQLKVEAENIVVSTGAKQAIINALLCIVNPGNEVIIAAPYWVSYLEMVKFAEGIPVIVHGSFENNFKVTADQIKKAITPQTKAIIYSSPCNPTGAIFSKEELTAIAEVVSKHPSIYIIADEIYEYICFTEEYFSIGSLDFIKDQVITINGFSKGFAMTGWRVGYLAAPLAIANACDKIQGQFTSATCSIAQRAALAALTSDLTPTHEMTKAYLRRRELVIKLLKQIPGIKTTVPDGAFYVFPDISSYLGKKYRDQIIRNATDLCMYLLNEAHVSIVTGEAFGEPNCVRISFAASDENLQKAFDRIKTALAQLQ